jgi:hypothetical protein
MLSYQGMKRLSKNGANAKRRMRRRNRSSVRRVSRSVCRRLGAPCQSTMLDLVRVVQPEVASATELVAVVRRLVRSGDVQLCGSFRGAQL